MFTSYNNVPQELQEVKVWETYEERDGMTIVERHTLINGTVVTDRVY